MKEPLWSKSRAAYVPVDDSPFQLLRNEDQWQREFNDAGLRVVKTFRGQAAGPEDAADHLPEILFVLVPLDPEQRGDA